MKLTPRTLLDLCNQTTSREESSSPTQSERLEILQGWNKHNPELLASLLLEEKGVDKKTGCHPLHWACGTGLDAIVSFLLDHYSNEYQIWLSKSPSSSSALVNQWAIKPSTGRTPLHYASRNGHLSTCKLLVEQYDANPNPKCHRGSVAPLQLAVWQNQLEIVQYLVEANGSVDHKRNISTGDNETNIPHKSVALETNDFHCGLNHWIGLIPKHRWLSDDGSGVLPLARYLHDHCGVSYTSTPNNQQAQGHTPLHKAAWGGNIALMKYFREEHHVYDTLQDAAGNYAADLAAMGGHLEAQTWLQQHASKSREKSCYVLGVPVTATNEEIQIRYKALARKCHPDKKLQQQAAASAAIAAQDANTAINTESDDVGDDQDFLRIKAAYEHLIHKGGAGNQRNPKYEALKLITSTNVSERKEKGSVNNDNKSHNRARGGNANNTKLGESKGGQDVSNSCGGDEEDEDDLFHARILAIISDYGDKGFPTSAIAKRWNQVWPDRPFPTPEQYTIEVPVVTNVGSNDGAKVKPVLQTNMVQKRVNLLKFLRWKCGDVVSFRKVNGVELAFAKKKKPNQ